MVNNPDWKFGHLFSGKSGWNYFTWHNSSINDNSTLFQNLDPINFCSIKAEFLSIPLSLSIHAPLYLQPPQRRIISAAGIESCFNFFKCLLSFSLLCFFSYRPAPFISIYLFLNNLFWNRTIAGIIISPIHLLYPLSKSLFSILLTSKTLPVIS